MNLNSKYIVQAKGTINDNRLVLDCYDPTYTNPSVIVSCSPDDDVRVGDTLSLRNLTADSLRHDEMTELCIDDSNRISYTDNHGFLRQGVVLRAERVEPGIQTVICTTLGREMGISRIGMTAVTALSFDFKEFKIGQLTQMTKCEWMNGLEFSFLMADFGARVVPENTRLTITVLNKTNKPQRFVAAVW